VKVKQNVFDKHLPNVYNIFKIEIHTQEKQIFNGRSLTSFLLS